MRHHTSSKRFKAISVDTLYHRSYRGGSSTHVDNNFDHNVDKQL